MKAQIKGCGETIDWIADADHAAGDVVQLHDGRAAVVTVKVASGDTVAVWVEGLFLMQATTSMVILMGSRLFWDYSAGSVSLLHGNDRDFFVGCAQPGGSSHTPGTVSAGVSGPTIAKTSAGTDVMVALKVKASNELSLGSGFATVPVYTAGINIGAFGTGEGVNLIKDATAEAQKVDALSFRAMAIGAKMIVDALICVNSDGNAASDTNVGLANGTHATDADSIAEHLFVHLDGGSTAIKMQSKDGTTTVTAADTTVVYVAGTPFLVQFDCSDLTDIQAYINGVNVLASSVFKLNAATGPLKLLAHSERSGTGTLSNHSILSLVARPAQV
ncbi:MAG TPA: DUF2190 family protein [Gemmataceae bacterium]|nr:DUF2190 family protein [Gemmataceae bacterium]